MAGSNAMRSLSLSVIVGTLLIPLSAVAAIWLTDPGAQAQAEPPATSTPLAGTPSTVQTKQVTTTPNSADLQLACGTEGMHLVDLEEAQAISDVQQAALDALRGLCEQQGMPLPARPATETVTRTVIVPSTAPQEAATATSSRDQDDGEHESEYDDHSQDEDHEDEDHEDEHDEHEDEHENEQGDDD